MKEQVLDQMDLEREKGITIKLQPVRMKYEAKDGERYILNLIDTPGHVDFSYEVSRSLAACEGALLVVDASQGIQAQTLANLYMAVEHELDIIPVVNKIDLPNAQTDRVIEEMVKILGCKKEDVYKVSAKTGEGVEDLLRGIVKKISVPKKSTVKDFRALIFDSQYDVYQGVVTFVRVFDGSVAKGDTIQAMSTQDTFEVLDVGVFVPEKKPTDALGVGEVGYIITGYKDVGRCAVGDTLASEKYRGSPLPGYKKIQPMVYASFYPVEAQEYETLRDALQKLSLNDASLQYRFESSPSLGRGVRVGFLGLLHMEIIHERLLREYDLNLIVTIPSVVYKVLMQSKEEVMLSNPSELPEMSLIESIQEPFVKLEIITPSSYLGAIMELCGKYRGEYTTTEYLDPTRAVLKYSIPLASVVTDFYDALKGVSSGFASLSYEMEGYKQSGVVKLDILIAGEIVDAFSRMVPRDETYSEGSRMVKKLKDVLPRQNFEIALQAAVGGKIIARETITAFRKDVTAGLYGGDVTRKQKLLKKQKKGKKKMKTIGQVPIPQEVFVEMMKK